MSTNYYAFTDETGPYDPDSDELMDEQGIHLGKRAGGWEPGLQRHGRPHGCPCGCAEPPYTKWESFKEFVHREDVTILDDYAKEWDADEFIDMLVDWKAKYSRTQLNSVTPEEYDDAVTQSVATRALASTERIDGWEFRGGVWS